MDEDHLEVVGECGQHSTVGLEVDVANGDGAVAQEAELPLDVELLQQEEAVGRHLHGAPLWWWRTQHEVSTPGGSGGGGVGVTSPDL